ncbi:MAG: hypothetical protein J7M03_05400 [Candidatus Desulfofervidaceae bacterium]|nr:hypothetical protein [Candidatus Desulfofervidaceae bacterium]MDL1970337.1 hypothetical protein [Candidatus Desulfofervidaceae bacterium]
MKRQIYLTIKRIITYTHYLLRVSVRIYLLINLFFLLACGVKTPPVMPKTEFRVKIYSFKAICEDGKIKLNWKYEGTGIKAFKVMRLCVPLEENICEGCPLRLQEIAQIKPDTQAEMTWFDLEAKGGYRCRYQICAVSENQVEKCSEIVQVVTEYK